MTRKFSKHFVIAAGGTGGHMLPAYSLAQELIYRGHRVMLITDERGRRIPGAPHGLEVITILAGRLTGANIKESVLSLWKMAQGIKQAYRAYGGFEPSAVVGFGGYPAFPALIAAFMRKIPTIIHEQNAVMGRVNRLVAGRVDAIATSYLHVERIKQEYRDKVTLTGNPVREAIAALRYKDYPPTSDDGVLRILITGGSQGSRIIGDVVPNAMAKLPVHLRERLQIMQQCRPEDIDIIRDRFISHDIPAELATYIDDMPAHFERAHIIIARAGASTIAEISCIGRPSILIPLGIATDDHQRYNAMELEQAGAASVIVEKDFTPNLLAKNLQKMALNRDKLRVSAARAKQFGRPDAVRALADLVENNGLSVRGDSMNVKAGKDIFVKADGQALAQSDTHS